MHELTAAASINKCRFYGYAGRRFYAAKEHVHPAPQLAFSSTTFIFLQNTYATARKSQTAMCIIARTTYVHRGPYDYYGGTY